MQNFNLSNYFPLLLIFGLSAASWIYGAIRQQAKRKRARAAARNRFEEQLRTGRSEEPTQGPKAAPMSQAQKLAARRQAQLQRLREQQAGTVATRPAGAPPQAPGFGQPLVRAPQRPQARPTGRPPTGVVIQRAPSSTPLPPRRIAPLQQAVRPPQAQQRPSGRRQIQKGAGGPAAPAKMFEAPDPRDVRRMRREQAKQAASSGKRSDQSRRIQTTPEKKPSRKAKTSSMQSSVRSLLFEGSGKRRSAAHYRSLIAISELLGKPMGARQDHELPWSRG